MRRFYYAIAVMLFGMGRAQAQTLPVLDLHDYVNENGQLLFRLDAPIKSLKGIDQHISKNKVVVFVPGVSSSQNDELFTSGPITKLHTFSAKKGVAIILELRSGTKLPAHHVKIQEHPYWHVAIGQRTEPTVNNVAVKSIENTEKNDLQARSLAGNPVNNLDEKEPAKNENKTTAFAWNSAPVQSTEKNIAIASTLPTPSASKALFISLGALLVVFAAFGFWLKRKKMIPMGDSIEVVAVRQLGGSHKLALVEACGDRFLIATSDKEVRLLSQLSSRDDGKNVDFADTLAQTNHVETSHEERKNLTKDIAGILRLRKNSPYARYAQNAAIPSDDNEAAA